MPKKLLPDPEVIFLYIRAKDAPKQACDSYN